ncbi:MAG: bifunctional phosphoribosylaminoimidazolecarboxamide formyltransferase/IMP cyclohydrolase [Pseudomonadota bacterium]|nr:bifunctional phosphoribosylaminoimidazolecarboxamide formyltransferase/IMP cyclohydrolase [Pseudomonadota bacterium]
MTSRRALLSVSDKTGLIPFATGLAAQGFEILSTGGTATALREAGLAVTDVADVTGFPEIMDGRVKTLHPNIHGGLLARRDNDSHIAVMQEQGIAGIDLLAVNLYPFEQQRAKTDDFATLVEYIDIGGPAMLRAAAKNHEFVTVLCDPADYDDVIAELAGSGDVSQATRRRLAGRVFARTAAYDRAIADWMTNESTDGGFGESMMLAGQRRQDLRYGENPHQKAALYAAGPARPGVASATQIQGKPLSYNNLNDTDAAFELAAEFTEPTIAIIKHANPCGVASATSLAAAWNAALAADPVSAFGGIVAANLPLDGETARRITGIFTEVVIAPEADAAARAILAEKPNLRLLTTGAMPAAGGDGVKIKSVSGGFLAQSRDNGMVTTDDLRIVTEAQPDAAQLADLMFAWRVVKHVKSNAIVFARDRCTVGVGAGQMSRVDSARIAAHKARDTAAHHGWESPRTIGSVAASDAFFPFADGLAALIEAGATAVIQPGGSKADETVIAAADAAGIVMAMTGMRHFNH